MEQQNYENRGYLHEDFRLFHIKDPIEKAVDWHYHTFHKIIVFLEGHASYGVEGKSYPLRQGDFILIGKGSIHRPEIAPGENYERIIIYISPDFLRRISTDGCDLELCFQKAAENFDFVLRPTAGKRELMNLLSQLEASVTDDGFGQELLRQSVFVQLLITISRGMMQKQIELVHTNACDEKTVALLRYFSEHLTEQFTADDLAQRFYVSKYHMMRRFKEETGYTIHSYVSTKRLMLARERIANGASPQDACYSTGFRDYSTFARAYKRLFSVPPSVKA